jgi:radical SAM superfamily enzyme YgiQ (UPF0313 family)
MKNIDIVLCVAAGVCVPEVTLAPAILKKYLLDADISSTIVDVNIRFYKEIDTDKINQVYQWLTSAIELDFPDVKELYNKFNDKWARKIVELNPKFVGMNIFTYQSQRSGTLLAKRIKELNPDVKIIFGGAGVSSIGIGSDVDFANKLLQEKAIDFFIRGPAEESLVQLIKGEQSAQINAVKHYRVDDKILKDVKYPDFADYDFSQYNKRALPIISSRGCVRKCSFCDVHLTSKYQYRQGKDVFDEMVHQSQQYGINYFTFTDSLNNGNLKEFIVLLTLLADYNSKTDNPIRWHSQYIIRAQNQLPDDYWELMSKSADEISIGIETGSDIVREHMNKGFTNDDIDYTFSQCFKYNIKVIVLIIVGYPTETRKDFQDTLDFFTKYQSLANNTIISVAVGNGLSITPNTPLMNNAANWHIELDEKSVDNWIAHDNPELTLDERIWRVETLSEHLTKLGYNFLGTGDELAKLKYEIPIYKKRNQVKKLIKIKEMKINDQRI